MNEDDTAGAAAPAVAVIRALRSQLQTAETLEWLETGRNDVVAFRRPNGWTSVTNFGTEAYELPAGEVLVSSAPITANSLPGATTAWIQS